MERRLFGRTGLSVPAVGVGTWQTFDVGGAAADVPRSVVDTAFDEGATMFDSSFMYGEAERVLGRALAGRRQRAIVATKVWTPDDAEAVRQVEAALRYFIADKYVNAFEALAANPSSKLVVVPMEASALAGGITQAMELLQAGRGAPLPGAAPLAGGGPWSRG